MLSLQDTAVLIHLQMKIVDCSYFIADVPHLLYTSPSLIFISS